MCNRTASFYAAGFQRVLAKPLLKLTITFSVSLIMWHSIVVLFQLPSFILPRPEQVLARLFSRHDVLINHGWVTLLEILLGLLLGSISGLTFALQLHLFKPLTRWLWPLLIVSQAIPVFALAPIFMLWLGYGIASKVVMAALIIFFPITTCTYDGLQSTPQGLIDQLRTMRASKYQLLWRVRVPYALPAIASGIRVATVVTPIGAVTGEWVGSSAGLGYLMLQANARMQIDELFAALFVLAIISISLYFSIDYLLRRWIYWKI